VYVNELLYFLTAKVVSLTITDKESLPAPPNIPPLYEPAGFGVLYQNSTEKSFVPTVIPGVIVKDVPEKRSEPGLTGVGDGVVV